jgi:hypothetical protein
MGAVLAAFTCCNSFFVNFIAETKFVCTWASYEKTATPAGAAQSVSYLQRAICWCNVFEKLRITDAVPTDGIAIARTNFESTTCEVQQTNHDSEYSLQKKPTPAASILRISAWLLKHRVLTVRSILHCCATGAAHRRGTK